jgi:hypothetical protein
MGFNPLLLALPIPIILDASMNKSIPKSIP